MDWINMALFLELFENDVDWETECCICPHCGEAIYSDDWLTIPSDGEVPICPFCGELIKEEK